MGELQDSATTVKWRNVLIITENDLNHTHVQKIILSLKCCNFKTLSFRTKMQQMDTFSDETVLVNVLEKSS